MSLSAKKHSDVVESCDKDGQNIKTLCVGV